MAFTLQSVMKGVQLFGKVAIYGVDIVTAVEAEYEYDQATGQPIDKSGMTAEEKQALATTKEDAAVTKIIARLSGDVAILQAVPDDVEQFVIKGAVRFLVWALKAFFTKA